MNPARAQVRQGSAAAIAQPPRVNPSAFPDAGGEQLAAIVARLVAGFDPLLIHLFGSAARGEAGADSDYDLLLVVADSQQAGLAASRRAASLLWGVPFAADVLVMRDSRFRAEAAVAGSLPAAVLAEGRLLYER